MGLGTEYSVYRVLSSIYGLAVPQWWGDDMRQRRPPYSDENLSSRYVLWYVE